jgi:hypothetical protein
MIASSISVDQATLSEFCRQHGIARLSLFGSALRDDFDATHSDIDLLVEFQPGVSKGLFKLVRMEHALGSIFHRQVDLTTAGSLSKYFRDDVLSAAVVLYDAA